MAGLVTWLKANFTFTTKQYNYLTGMSAAFSLHLGGLIGAAVIARWPILVGFPPDYGPPRRTKQVKIDCDGWTGWFPEIIGPGAITGDFSLRIGFEVVD